MKPETELYLREVFAELRGMKGPWTYRIFSSGPTPVYEVWDYLNDERQKLPRLTLDEVHEAFLCLTVEQRIECLGIIHRMSLEAGKTGLEGELFKIYLDKYKRAEAIARVLGKWKE